MSDSLGGKAVLWELFSFNPPTLQAVRRAVRRVPVPVRHPDQQPRHDRRADGQPARGQAARPAAARSSRWPSCPAAPKTSSRSCTASRTRSTCASACATSSARTTSRTRTRALADVAEACLKEIAAAETAKLAEKLGEPTIGPLAGESEPPTASRAPPWQPLRRPTSAHACELIVLALGKLGGREPNYHSDLDLVFLYEADGTTVARRRGARGSRPATATSSASWASGSSRPPASSARTAGCTRSIRGCGPPAAAARWPCRSTAFVRYFREGDGQLWERQALCKARVIVGSPDGRRAGDGAVDGRDLLPAVAAAGRRRDPRDAAPARRVRLAARTSSAAPAARWTPSSSCRCCSSSTAASGREIRVPGTLDALGGAGRRPAAWRPTTRSSLAASYRFQRSVEARIRLMDAAGRHEFPDEPRELAKLAFCWATPTPSKLVARGREHAGAKPRERFDRIFAPPRRADISSRRIAE